MPDIQIRPVGDTVHPDDAAAFSQAVHSDDAAAFEKAKASGEFSFSGAAKSAGVGLGRGVISMLGTPGDIGHLASVSTDYIADKLGASPESTQEFKKLFVDQAKRSPVLAPFTMPGSQELTKGIEQNITGDFYKPQNKTEEYLETGGSFLPAALPGPASLAKKLMLQAAVPAVASETAGQMTKGTAAEPWARAAAGLGTGILGAILSAPRSVANTLRQRLPEGVTGAHVDRAEQLILSAQRRGINITWPEALSQVSGRPVLTDLQRILESSEPSRAQMQNYMGERPHQIDTAARAQFEAISPPTHQPSVIGPAASAAATGAVNDVRGAINRASQPFYDRASTHLLTPAEMARVRAIPGYEQAARAVRNDPQLNRYVAHLPDHSVGFLDEVKKYFNNAAELAASPVQQGRNMQRAAGFERSARDVRAAATTASPVDYPTALAVQQHARQRYLEPLLRGPLGRIADTPETKAAINALFPANPLAGSAQEVSTAVSAIAQRNPTVARLLVRAHAEQTFNEATQNLQSGANQMGGAKFSAVIAGNPQQRANLRAAVEALPNGAQTWRGFERFLEVLDATGTRQQIGSKTAFNIDELKALGSGGAIANAVKLGAAPGKWWTAVYDKWSKWQFGSNLNELATIITDPQAGAMLRKIAEMPGVTSNVIVAAARITAQVNPSGSRPRE